MTDPRNKRPPALSPTKRELRFWLVAALAGIHALVWSALGVRDESAGVMVDDEPEAERATASALVGVPTPRVVWLDALPSSERPVIEVPAGWEVVSRDAPPPRAEVTRVARSRARRVRTRSS